MCTTIFLRDKSGMVLANNQDIFLENFMWFTNKRDVSKRALIMPPDVPVEWITGYGSVTFSQVGKEFPSGGMNEAGLAVVQMTLLETVYPHPDERPGIKEMQYIQYLLDTCETVDEAIQASKKLRISQASWMIHYMLADKVGQAAVIEFLNGNMVVHTGSTLEVKALANSVYEDSLKYIHSDKLSVEMIENPYTKDSIKRFVKAAAAIRRGTNRHISLVDYSFEALERVAREDTVWSTVCDISKLRIYFRTKSFPGVKYFDLKKLDFSKGTRPKVLKAFTGLSGDVIDSFEDYSTDLNKSLVYGFFKNEELKGIMGLDIPDEALEYLAAYPEQH